jgi:tRNA threonylcarbamoyladenosine biosynthesis protein TsaB
MTLLVFSINSKNTKIAIIDNYSKQGRSLATALIFHTTYTTVQLAFSSDTHLIDSVTLAKHQASRDIIDAVDLLLDRNTSTLEACSFLGAYRGPAPFTTLRVTLATVNGLAFAAKLPLVAIDGLQAAAPLFSQLSTPYGALILNAFCDDVYFALYDSSTNIIEQGCEHITNFIKRLEQIAASSTETGPLITCIGNGTALHKEILKQALGNQLFIPHPIPEGCSLEAVHTYAWLQWHKHITFDQILPLYLKSSSAILRPCIAV